MDDQRKDDTGDRWVREVLRPLKEEVHAPPELRHQVMERISRRSWAGEIWSWVVRPRLIPVSPAMAGAAIAAVAALIFVGPDRTVAPEAAAPAEEKSEE